jgi:hypothetical protein
LKDAGVRHAKELQDAEAALEKVTIILCLPMDILKKIMIGQEQVRGRFRGMGKGTGSRSGRCEWYCSKK